MASAIIHICVAKEINKKMNVSVKELYLGSIAPDVSKEIGGSRTDSHFLDFDNGYPNIERFINKYRNNLSDPFVLGYLTHLVTDKLWIDFLQEYVLEDNIYNKNGDNILVIDKDIKTLLYEDYTSLNQVLINEYELELSLFYEELIVPNCIIDEVPMNKLNLIVDKIGTIIYNSKMDKQLLLNERKIVDFIGKCRDAVLEYLN